MSMLSRAVSILMCYFLMQGCSYNAKIQTPPPINSAIAGSKQAVTLVDNRDEISDLKLKHGVATLSYDVKDSLIAVSANALKSTFAKVDIAKAPLPSNPIYAVSHFDVEAMKGNDATTGMTSQAKLDFFDTASKQLLGSITVAQDSQYSRPSSLDSLGFLTGLTLFVIAPITLPQAVHIAGDAVGELITENEKGLAGKLTREISSRQAYFASYTPGTGYSGSQQKNCFQSMEDNSVLDPLRGKLFRVDGTSRFDMLTNNSRPTKPEKAAIRVYYEEFMGCFASFETSLSSAPREVHSMFENLKNGYDNLLAKLYNGEISFGEYLRKSEELDGNFNQNAEKIYADLEKERRADARTRAQLEIQDRQAAAAADMAAAQRQSNWMQAFQNIQQNMLQMQTINSINRLSAPSPRLGVNCTSRSLGGGTINTNCY